MQYQLHAGFVKNHSIHIYTRAQQRNYIPVIRTVLITFVKTSNLAAEIQTMRHIFSPFS